MSPDKIIEIWKSTQNQEEFRKLIKQEGFIYLGKGLDTKVYGHKKAEFVVKISRDKLPTRKFKEPALEEFRLGYLYINRGRNVGLQQRVQRKNRLKAFNKICENANIDLIQYDIHIQNVGWLDGKPKIIDYV